MIQTYSPDMKPRSFEDKKIVHQKGLWHKVFTGILFNPDTNKIFLQTIFPKNSYDFDRPDFVDFSVGGHVENNETIVQTALRETKEELGVSITAQQLTFLGIRICKTNPSPSYIIREFQYFFAILTTQTLDTLSLCPLDNEVKSLIEVDLGDFIALILQQTSTITARERLIQSQQIAPISLTPERIIPDYFTDKSIAEKLLSLCVMNNL